MGLEFIELRCAILQPTQMISLPSSVTFFKMMMMMVVVVVVVVVVVRGGVDFPLFCSLICLQNEAQSDSAKAKIIKEQREYLAVGERGASSL